MRHSGAAVSPGRNVQSCTRSLNVQGHLPGVQDDSALLEAISRHRTTRTAATAVATVRCWLWQMPWERMSTAVALPMFAEGRGCWKRTRSGALGHTAAQLCHFTEQKSSHLESTPCPMHAWAPPSAGGGTKQLAAVCLWRPCCRQCGARRVQRWRHSKCAPLRAVCAAYATCGGAAAGSSSRVTARLCCCRPVQALVPERGKLVHEQGESWLLLTSELKVLAVAPHAQSHSCAVMMRLPTPAP